MTALAARPGRGGQDAEAIAVAACPADPCELIAGFRLMLWRAMKPRANGTRHLDSCRNARINATWFACQPECEQAQILLVWGDVWSERNVAPRRVARGAGMEGRTG